MVKWKFVHVSFPSIQREIELGTFRRMEQVKFLFESKFYSRTHSNPWDDETKKKKRGSEGAGGYGGWIKREKGTVPRALSNTSSLYSLTKFSTTRLKRPPTNHYYITDPTRYGRAFPTQVFNSFPNKYLLRVSFSGRRPAYKLGTRSLFTNRLKLSPHDFYITYLSNKPFMHPTQL